MLLRHLTYCSVRYDCYSSQDASLPLSRLEVLLIVGLNVWENTTVACYTHGILSPRTP